MTEPNFEFQLDGQELQQSDVSLISTEASHASQYAIAEMLRMLPYNGAVTKVIIPYAVNAPDYVTQGSNGPMVQTNGGSGTVLLMPFTAVVGSRVGPSATSTDPVDTTGAMLNWRDIRTAVYAVSDNSTVLGHAVSFTANSSGLQRWDLVYATVQCDQVGAQIQRFVQPPNTPVPTTTTAVNPPISQVITINVVTGTPGTPPARPATPADTLGQTGTYNIPLAYVQIPNGFNGSSVITAQQIHIVAPVAHLSSKAFATSDVSVPTGFSRDLPVAASNTWGTTGTRPGEAFPTSLSGSRKFVFGFDATTASPLIGDAGILDQTIDWRNRICLVTVVANTAIGFAWSHGAVSGTIVPSAAGTDVLSTHFGQTFVDDSLLKLGTSRNGGVVVYLNGSNFSPIAGGSNSIGFYADLTTGALKVYYQGNPGCRLFFVIEAFGQFDNV